jgi:hypothetical protein
MLSPLLKYYAIESLKRRGIVFYTHLYCVKYYYEYVNDVSPQERQLGKDILRHYEDEVRSQRIANYSRHKAIPSITSDRIGTPKHFSSS